MSIQDADVADVESCSRKPSRPVVRKLRLDPLRVKLNEFGHERCPPWSGLLIASSGISFFSAGSRKVYRSWGRLQAPKTFGPKKPASAAEKPGDVQSSVRRPPHRDPSNLISPTPIVVVEIVAVKALWNHSEPQCSIRRPQRIQSKSLIFTQFQQISTSRRIWFGTRFSTQNFLHRINKLQPRDVEPGGFVRISQPQNRLQRLLEQPGGSRK